MKLSVNSRKLGLSGGGGLLHSQPTTSAQQQQPKSRSIWQILAITTLAILIPWAVYVNFHPSITQSDHHLIIAHSNEEAHNSLGQLTSHQKSAQLLKRLSDAIDAMHAANALPNSQSINNQLDQSILSHNSVSGTPIGRVNSPPSPVIPETGLRAQSLQPPPPPPPAAAATTATTLNTATVTGIASPSGGKFLPFLPVQGPVASEGVKPLFGVKHKGTDAIFALACNYPTLFYERFVGSLRKTGYNDDIVLAVSTPDKMKPGVEQYIKDTNVVGYGFDVDCEGKDNCRLRNDFLGYQDPRPFRTFANIRYALYEYWIYAGQYSETSYILILDFRDTFFQKNPFSEFGLIQNRAPTYDLKLYEENFKVKSIGKCVYNSLWIGRCFGKEALEKLKLKPVLCSGSTLGSVPAIRYYVQTMLRSMDTVKCWLKGIESDQGYQNYLFYNGYFNEPKEYAIYKGIGRNATAFSQGTGIVNTIGALNGFRVPAAMKGPLDTHWRIRDGPNGAILNYDQSVSAVVHQWDRWYKEIAGYLDKKLIK